MSSHIPIANVVSFISPDDSEFDLSDSSGDEFIPRSSDESEETDYDQPSTSTAPPKKRKTKKRTTENKKRDRCLEYSSSDEEDYIPLAHLRYKELMANVNEEMFAQSWWEEMDFHPPDSTFKGVEETAPVDETLKSPFELFKDFVTDKMLDEIVQQTNTYALQKSGKELKVTKKEIETFIGLSFRMGLMQAHAVRAFWEHEKRYPPVADFIFRDRFQAIAAHIHFVDNLSTPESVKTTDKVWKLRPWLTNLCDNFRRVPLDEHSTVDEIMIPLKGRSSLKQYIRGKPKPWGFKLWGRSGSSGFLYYDFDVYQGRDATLENDEEGKKMRAALEVGGSVVVKLSRDIPQHQNYKLFADNFFTNLNLAQELKKKGILFTGTVRVNRLKGCVLKEEKELRGNGRGSTDSKVEVDSNIVAVRWYDNKCVDLISSYVGPKINTHVRRLDKKAKEQVEIPLPTIIEEYNKFMGGIDLLDSLTSLYKYHMKSRRFYVLIFLHTLHVAVVNAWLLHKRHSQLLKLPPMRLAAFQVHLSTALVQVQRPVGRPKTKPASTPSRPIRRKAPIPDVRSDGIDHLPHIGGRNRCKNKNCVGKSSIYCAKCNVPLCLTKDRNFFMEFHKL